MILAWAQGAKDLVVLGATGNKLDCVLVSGPHIKKPADLKGKRIAISQLGARTDFIARLAVRQLGLNEKNVSLLGIGAQGERWAALAGGHVDAQEALLIGLINQVAPKAELLETCFKFVDRVAHVPPETVKINLHISTQGLEMMGLRKALMLNAELASMARVTKREEFNRRLQEAKKKGGLDAFLKERDGPFQPEPFGPKTKKIG